MKQFINLHAHSTGSLLDGASKFEEYAERAKKLGQPMITFTDHGNLHGVLDAYDAAREAGIKYLPGLEAYQARKTRFDMDEEERAGKARSEWDQRGPYHLGIIAYNNVGYHNLIKISSRSYLEGYYVKGRIDHNLIADHAEGLVILSGCLSGEVQQAILRGDYDYALDAAAKMQDIVGRDNYFIELQNHGIEEESQTWASLIMIAKTIDAPIVTTCDSHYTNKEDAHYHDLTLCISTGAKFADESRFKFSGDGFYLKSYDEMVALFGEEQYVDNTMLVYDKFDFELDFEENHYPKYPMPMGETSEQLFDKLIQEGAVKRFGDDWKTKRLDIAERIAYESEVIKDQGFLDYFLVVWDIVDYARRRDIMVGPARGSVAGCLIAYLLFITEVDPVKYKLMLERFLVPGRKSPPDIDLDFDSRYREEVVQYTRNKYGSDHTANIGTMGTIKARKAVRDVSRVLDYPYELGDKISKAMPPALFGIPVPLEKCLQTDDFRSLYESDADVKDVVDQAMKVEGLWRDPGIHAAGLVVADKPIIEYVPVIQKGEGQPIVTQWDLSRIEQLGLLKIDFLGLRNLDIITLCLESAAKTKDYHIDNVYHLLDDPEATKLVCDELSQGKTMGSFQLESQGIQELTVALQPSKQHEISDILSLYRPGPMGSNVHREYIERKFKRKPVTVLHPSLDPILSRTYGLLIYQEQLLKIATDVAGFSIGEADDMRKIVGKKQVEKMPKMREKFVTGCVNTVAMRRDVATKLFDEIEHHASYSFGEGHATGYMFLSFVTTYLHAKFPAEFMAAALTTVVQKEDRLRDYLNECQHLNIKVLPPNLADSEQAFKVKDDQNIYYGLGAIKGITEATITPVLRGRENIGYDNLYAFLRNVDTGVLNKKVVDHFMAAGAFDELLEPIKFFEGIDVLSKPKYIEALFEEFEELNAFVSDHPYQELKNIVSPTHDFEPIKRAFYMNEGDIFTTAGIIVKADKMMTRRGKRMYKLVIQDLDNSIEVDVMPKIAETLSERPFNKGDFLIVKGGIDKFGEEENSIVSIRLYDYTLTNISDLVESDNIYLKCQNEVTVNKINKIVGLIKNNKGGSTVYLDFYDTINNANVRIRFEDTANKKSETILRKVLEV